MLPLLILAAIAAPLLEIAVISQLLVWAPWPLVLAVVVVGTVTGLVVLRQDGLAHLQRWRTAHRRRAVPDVATIVGGLRDVAAILLAVPGVVTTVAGLVLLVHPVRAAMARGIVDGDRRRRRRRVPSTTVPATPVLVPAPAPPALVPGSAEDQEAAAWDAYALAPAPARAGHIAGQSEIHGAVVDDFFGGAETPRPLQAGWPAAIPPAPPLPPVLPPPALTRHPPAPGADRSEASADEGSWDSFMQGRGWEDEPERHRRRRRSTATGKRRRAARGDRATGEDE